MNKKILKFVLATFLLLCFTTGQVIVFTHSHAAALKTAQSKHKTPNPDEVCKICHLSHATTALLYADDLSYGFNGQLYKQLQLESLSYHSIALLLSNYRGPPAV